MPPPLAFTDEQIAAIMNAAQPLARADRAEFLEAVVESLDGKALGDGRSSGRSGRSRAAISMPRNGGRGRGAAPASTKMRERVIIGTRIGTRHVSTGRDWG
jgi:hypothetical protein